MIYIELQPSRLVQTFPATKRSDDRALTTSAPGTAIIGSRPVSRLVVAAQLEQLSLPTDRYEYRAVRAKFMRYLLPFKISRGAVPGHPDDHAQGEDGSHQQPGITDSVRQREFRSQ